MQYYTNVALAHTDHCCRAEMSDDLHQWQ